MSLNFVPGPGIIAMVGVPHLHAAAGKPLVIAAAMNLDIFTALQRAQAWVLPPLVAAGLLLIAIAAVMVWTRDRRLGTQRERLRKTYELGEEILGASSDEAILTRIAEELPSILGVTRVHLYVYNRAAKSLDGVSGATGESVSISLSSTPAGTHAGAVACFNYRTLLAIPDIARSPFPITSAEGTRIPKSLLFVPMKAQEAVVGIMELDQDDRARDFTPDEQSLAQHLGNQVGAALRLLNQRSVQEQLSRTEKMAAVSQLISGVVSELQTPLASITELANLAVEKGRHGPAEREIAAIASEASKASAIVTRLVSYAAAERSGARPISISELLRNLIEFREGDWKASGIRVQEAVSTEPLTVLGSQGQLEQVFLNLLVHAEQAVAEAPTKTISIRTSLLARRLMVEIAFSAPAGSRKPEETAAILSVARSVVASHGGEVRLVEKPNTNPHFEVDLPVSSRERTGTPAAAERRAPEPGRRRIGMIIEPDEAAQKQLTGLLSSRGFRVVPVVNADNGLELAHRMRFDAAFCAVRAPGLNWVELSERLHTRVGGFVLLSDGYDAELSADFEGEGRYVLAKPLQESELDRIIDSIAAASAAKVVNIRDIVA